MTVNNYTTGLLPILIGHLWIKSDDPEYLITSLVKAQESTYRAKYLFKIDPNPSKEKISLELGLNSINISIPWITAPPSMPLTFPIVELDETDSIELINF